MAGSGWEPWVPPEGGARPADAGPQRLERSPRRGGVLLVVVVVVGAALAGWTVAGPGAGSSGDGTTPTTLATPTTPTTLADQNADLAFAQAGGRLEEAGSFAYSGYVAINDPSTDLSPGRSVRGQAQVASGSSRQVSASGPNEPVVETLVTGPTAWKRRAPTPDQLEATPFTFAGDAGALADDHPLRGGAALLPRWLERTSDPRYLGTDGTDRIFRAALPTAELASLGLDVLDADADGKVAVDLWVDAGGTPTRIAIGLNPRILDVTITEIGTPVAVHPPPNHPSRSESSLR